ncbi:MAG: BspA family leucine-rich repeat surface protein [bacterium]
MKNFFRNFSFIKLLLTAVFFVFSVSIFLPQTVEASTPFITTWKTDNPGTSASNQITIPTRGGGYNYNVDWGDTTTSSGVTGNITHTYATPGTYTVSISGTFPGIYFNGGGDRRKILTVQQWGTIGWTFMNHAFEGASNLTSTAVDVPILSGVTDMSYMFKNAPLWNANNMPGWNTSNVTLMNWMFYNDTAFNQDISSWNVSHVTDMSFMFGGDSAMAFNQPIGTWTTTSLTLANWMFYNATSFNQPLDSWDVSHVTDMSYMFQNASAFNQSLNSWSTSNVYYMNSMFKNATHFNGNISSWNTSGLHVMDQMFSGATVFNGAIGSWDVSHVNNMDSIFWNDAAFNQNINAWNMSTVTYTGNMFSGDTAFNQDLHSWDVSHVLNMDSMFYHDTAFNQSLSTWDVSGVLYMGNMFDGVTLSTANYDATLAAWSLESLRILVTLDAGNSRYCSSVTQRASMISVRGWTINDGGLGCFTLTYTAGANGSINGTTPQTVSLGANGSAVTAVPNSGYSFSGWSDSSTTNPRTDTSVGGNISATALFAALPVAVSNHTGHAVIAVNPRAMDNSSNLDFSINDGAVTTTSPVVALTLNADPNTVNGYAVSLDSTFANTGIQTYARGTKGSFQLPNKSGTYTLYVEYFSTTGNHSPVISKTISYNPSGSNINSVNQSTNSKNVFTRTLNFGSNGSDVTALQKFLIKDGELIFPSGSMYGNFGKLTQTALKKFQIKYKISKSGDAGYGVFGPKTRAQVNVLSI